MDESMQQAIGVPDIAIGMVDVATAESGIALAFKFGPLLAKNAEKELFITDIMDKMLDDIVMGWLPAMEDVIVDNVLVTSVVDDPLPKNQSQLLQDLLGIFGVMESMIPVQFVFDKINEIMGWDLTPDDFDQALKDQLKIMINEARVQAALSQAAPQGGQNGQSPNGKGGGSIAPQKPSMGGVFQLDNLTKYTQSERLSKQTGSQTGAYGGSLQSALGSGGI
jgi:hypothetical protein